MLVVLLPITRQRRLFCLFVCRDTLTYYDVGALSLSIPHGMHLVILTHHCFFWAICHLSRTFPPNELEQEPQNRFFPLPIATPYPLTSYLLPLTHDPPPPVLARYRLVKSGPCACLISVCVQNLLAAFAVVWRLVCTSCHPFLTSYGVSYFLIPHSL